MSGTPAPAKAATTVWTAEQAERYLLALELFGMRFGIERMRRLLRQLGDPQTSFASVHVVGTNGKSSTVRMIAAILERHAVGTGVFLSPHLVSFSERIRVGDADVTPERFAAAVQRAAAAAEQIDAVAETDDQVTQFEAVTAAAFSELAAANVDTAVIEAGLGGRWDATNVLPSKVQVLTNVALEHTQWLGSTVAAIATEKLDVVQPGGTLVVGADLHPDALSLAEQICADRDATLVCAPADTGIHLRAAGAYQRANFAVAVEAARAALLARTDPIALDHEAVLAAGNMTAVPGRFDLIDTRPDTYIDGAHNPAGITALAAALAGVQEGRRIAIAASVLEDKDAVGMLGQLLPLCDVLVCTSNANPRALAATDLQAAAADMGFGRILVEADPHAALRRARDEAGPEGIAVAAGSIYLIADLLRPVGAAPGSTL